MNLQPTHLRDKLIRLVPLHAQHFEALFAAASDPLIWEQHPTKDRYKREVFQQFFDSAIAGKAAFLVLELDTNKVIGSSRYYDYNGKQKSVAIGYTFLTRHYWGGRYNHSLKKLMMDYAFESVDAIIFHIGECNLRSQVATQRLGAQKLNHVEEIRNGQQLVRNLVYQLTKSQWQGINI
ncbi:MAG: GNAT family N-acetyltransferase [Cytophagales bacterium]